MKSAADCLSIFVKRHEVKTQEKWEIGLCETKRKFLALIAGNKIMAIPVMAEKLDINKTAVENNLKKLKANGAIRMAAYGGSIVKTHLNNKGS